MALTMPLIMEGLGSMWCDLFYKTFHSVFEKNTLHLFISMCSKEEIGYAKTCKNFSHFCPFVDHIKYRFTYVLFL